MNNFEAEEIDEIMIDGSVHVNEASVRQPATAFGDGLGGVEDDVVFLLAVEGV